MFYKLFILFTIVSLLIFGYGYFRCQNPDYKDPLMKKFGIWDLDGWSVTHFTLFFIIGYFFKNPNEWLVAWLLGTSWEVFEHVVGDKRPGWLGGFGDCITTDENIKDKGNWWFGRLSDILMNTSGLLLGIYSSRQL